MNMLQIAWLKEAAVDLLFPQWCLGCGREGACICPSCRQRLPRLTESLCPTCGQSQPGGLPLHAGSLIKRRPTDPQAETDSLAGRWVNVAGAYGRPDATSNGREVLLVDDVATSGATLNACAEVLKAAGANSVWALVLAREV